MRSHLLSFVTKEGYDIIPIHMVKVLHEETKQEDDEEETTITNIEPRDLKLIEEISICDKDLANEGPNDENDHQEHVYYDASDELEDYEEPESIVVQLCPVKGRERDHYSTRVDRSTKAKKAPTANKNKRAEICTRISWETTLFKVFSGQGLC